MQVLPLSSHPKTLLLAIQAPFYRHDGRLFQERQACNGLRMWGENFAYLHVMAPVHDGPPPVGWVPMGDLGPLLDRIECHLFPAAFRPDRFLRALPDARKRIRTLIKRSDHLCFATGGLWGDWGAVGVFEAEKMGRKSSIWTDQVCSQLMWRTRDARGLKHRIMAWGSYLPMRWLERRLAQRAQLGLYHGNDTFSRFAPYSRHPFMMHNVHLTARDHIRPATLSRKLAAVQHGPLRICYVGRATAMKGPFDWLSVLRELADQGIDFEATWVGDGEALAQMRAQVAQSGLDRRVRLPGFNDDHGKVLKTLQHAHVLMFCHKTMESPRVLIEALVSGCPIVGYQSAYSQELIAQKGGGFLTPMDEIRALTAAVRHLALDRMALGALIDRATRDGAPFETRALFKQRSDLIKQYA
jgi:glycosyltransferase involved in cell wall biosynthesis